VYGSDGGQLQTNINQECPAVLEKNKKKKVWK
jgi:hypothetical protein